ncbi:hypothetical protein FRC17_000938 [Serendipita sp. 399]|nr:hypothetical protein FRC17_000938 [Serendipita sp. 399]
MLYDSLPPTTPEQPQKLVLPPLKPIQTGFFVPRLENKPQDPIIDTLDLESAGARRLRTNELVIGSANDDRLSKAIGQVSYFEPANALKIVDPSERQRKPPEGNIWLIAAAGSDAQGKYIKSWETIRDTHTRDADRGCLLSEQAPDTFVAAQAFAMPHVHPTGSIRRDIPPIELFEILLTNLTGHSSKLYEWDAATENFVRCQSVEGEVILAYGFTEMMSNEIIQRYLDIGTCLRRLDGVINGLRQSHIHSTMHAFLHGLETLTEAFRRRLGRVRLDRTAVLSRLWLQHTEIQEVLVALSELCNADLSLSPPFVALPNEPASLLSHVYTFTERHFRASSARVLRAALAFLLSTASRPWFREIEHSIGIGQSMGDGVVISRRLSTEYTETDELGFNIETRAEDLDLDAEPPIYPTFFDENLKHESFKATRSLKVLAAADPNHPLLKAGEDRRCEWVWHEERLNGIYSGLHDRPFEQAADQQRPLSQQALVTVNPSAMSYPSELQQFRIFDMEPGAQWVQGDQSHTSLPIDITPFQSFLSSFPEELPSSTPTLAHLASFILHPLQLQSNRLTNALLDLFLSAPLSLRSHFSLLRSFMLLSSQNFTYRLRGALFSDSDAYQPIDRGTRARTRARLGIKDQRDIIAENEDLNQGQGGPASAAKWGIGLAVGLSERGIWPPGGAELGFALRRVIVDTLDEMKDADEVSEDEDGSQDSETNPKSSRFLADSVVTEAEWRLGFAIRDLPTDEGRDEWLNPSSIAALDFLYLEYKPPLPVGALITSTILSKYQRIFTFLLRLLRVDTVSRGLFHTLHKGPPIFEDNIAALYLLRRFRFQTHAFISILTSYVFDTVIGAQFDGFMTRLDEIDHMHDARRRERNEREDEDLDLQDTLKPVADVFEIMADHSRTLDKILGGCLLRIQQRAISEVLQDILSTVLLLGCLVRDLKRKALSQEDAATQLQKLYVSFERKMFTLTKVLRAMDDKSELRSLLSAIATSDRDYEILARNTGGQKREIGLSDLLVRMDPGEWWKGEMERRIRAKKEKEEAMVR